VNILWKNEYLFGKRMIGSWMKVRDVLHTIEEEKSDFQDGNRFCFCAIGSGY
jgi:hypothetical protein